MNYPKIRKRLKVKFKDDQGKIQIGTVKHTDKFCYYVNVGVQVFIVSRKEVIERV